MTEPSSPLKGPLEPGRIEQVTVDDGSFDLSVWLPKSGQGPGLLLLHEIFGVGPYIKAVAHDLADLGYVVAAPDLFWPLQPNWVADHDEAGLKASMELVQQLDFPQAIADSVTALHHLAGLPEVAGGTGVIGLCLGGTLAWFVAAVSNPVVAVVYYGSGIVDGLDQLDHVECPLLLHFGDADGFIPNHDIERVAKAVASSDHIELHVQPGAGHAFDNHEAPAFFDADASAAARELTTGFLRRHLPPT